MYFRKQKDINVLTVLLQARQNILSPAITNSGYGFDHEFTDNISLS